MNFNLTCSANRLTPFDSYFGQNTNTPHISLSKEMVDWLMKELGTLNILPVPQSPSFPMDQNALQGSATICLNTNITYSFADVCKIPSGVTWSVSSTLQIISFTNTSVIVSGLFNAQGVLTATFQNGQTVTKNIWVGIPQITGFFCPDDSTICSGTFCQQGLGLPAFSFTNSVVANSSGLTATQMIDKANWEWERINTNIVIAQDIQGNQIYIAPNYVGQTGVRARAKNNCGWSEWSKLYFEIVNCNINFS